MGRTPRLSDALEQLSNEAVERQAALVITSFGLVLPVKMRVESPGKAPAQRPIMCEQDLTNVDIME
jgi:hypothetical protein